MTPPRLPRPPRPSRPSRPSHPSSCAAQPTVAYSHPLPPPPPPPTTAQVYAGAHVSIVLKADQRSGRQITGVVQNLLTRGNHPRGIKVRLTDGRIGRVQRALDNAGSGGTGSASVNSTGFAPLFSSEEIPPYRSGGSAVQDRSSNLRYQHQQHQSQQQKQQRYSDTRLEEESELPDSHFELAAFIKAPKLRKKGTAAVTTINEEMTAVVSCPVCNIFKGDEVAVARHVEEHFT